MKRSTKSCQRRKKNTSQQQEKPQQPRHSPLKGRMRFRETINQLRDTKRNSLIAMLPVELNFTVRIGLQRGTN